MLRVVISFNGEWESDSKERKRDTVWSSKKNYGTSTNTVNVDTHIRSADNKHEML